MRHVVSRSVRDSAAVLDVLQGYMTGDPVHRAAADAAVRATRSAPIPASCASACARTRRAASRRPIPVCIAAVDDAAALLESLGHTVEDSAPAALERERPHGPVQRGDDVVPARRPRRDRRDRGPAAHRRRRRADDVALLRDAAAATTAATYVHAVDEMHRWTRRVVSWWLDDGFDLLLTPTLAEPPPVLGDVGRQDDGGLNAAGALDPVRRVHRAVQRDRPARDVGAAVLERRRACPIGVQLVGAPYREDLLIRVAAQLEQARPWARPPPARSRLSSTRRLA